MNNVDKDQPADIGSQSEPGKSPAEATESGNDQKTDAAGKSELEIQKSADGGGEKRVTDTPHAPASSETSETTEPIGPQTEWPPQEISKAEELGQNDIAVDQTDEQSTESCVETDVAVSKNSEIDVQSENDDELVAKTDDEVTAELEKQRDFIVTKLFGVERPSQANADTMLQSYSAAVNMASESGIPNLDEATTVAQRVSEIHKIKFASEKSEFDGLIGQVNRNIETYDNLFAELDIFISHTSKELARLDVEDEKFRIAPEELKTTLINFRKGVEIIGRMFIRAKDRKKALAEETPQPLGDDWDTEHLPTNGKSIGEFVEQLAESFHKLRDRNYHANQDAKSFSEKCKKATANAAIGLLSAIDGIDAGLQNDSGIRAGLASFEEGEGNCSELIESWFQAYLKLNTLAEQFFSKTGIEGHTVEPGTPFDPETMEPQGTISNPELNDEDVAAVLRRGFSLNGESIRPILVEVVINS